MKKALTEKQLRSLLADQAKAAGGVRPLWVKLGKPCAWSFFHDVMSGKRTISANFAEKVGYEKKVIFYPK